MALRLKKGVMELLEEASAEVEPVCHMGGGFTAWKAAGGAVEAGKKP